MKENIYRILEEKICSYCKNNKKGKKVLFYAFFNCGSLERESVSIKDLRNSTERIVKDLIKKEILIEVKTPEEFNTPFGSYQIISS